MAAERLWRGRRTAVALDSGRPEQDRSYVETPDVEMVVVASDGVPLHVEIDEARSPSAGQPGRPTVVFSHGYCMSLQSWVFQRRALREAGYRVVLWDQRGHGRSGVGDRDSYDIDQLGEDLSMVIRTAVGDGPVVLVGHSMGGMTMMAMALVDEEQVTAQVVGAAFLATTTGRIAEVSFGLARPIGQLIHWVAPAAALTLASRQHLVDGTVRAGREIVDFFVDWGSFGSPVPLSIAQLTTDMIVGTRMDTISAFMPRFSAHDKREALAAYRGTEALVLNGTRDKLCPPDHSAEIVRQLPGAEHVVVQEAGHIIMLEHPQLVNEQLMALVQRSHRHPAEAGSYDLDALVSGAGRSAQGPVGRHEEAATRRALHRRSRRGLRTRPREQEPPS
ncbi:MAG: alpha/beta hydrolase [Austwickia sp.]|nr:alpha/beta hydrolase [Austwickia sp.]MBK8436138.1 alpha/beta hydrolase [Austwickia sp.]